MLNLNIELIKHLLHYLAVLSLVTFAVSALCIPYLIARLPVDSFAYSTLVQTTTRPKSSFFSIPLLLLRNIVGFLLMIAGIIMLFLPGQGIITIVISLLVMTFPYKNRLIYNLTRPQSVQTSLNWIRKKTGKAPFQW